MIMRLKERIERGTQYVRCECGAIAVLTSCTEEECDKYGCGRDVPGNECCAVAFLCDKCGKRYVGTKEAPDMDWGSDVD